MGVGAERPKTWGGSSQKLGGSTAFEADVGRIDRYPRDQRDQRDQLIVFETVHVTLDWSKIMDG